MKLMQELSQINALLFISIIHVNTNVRVESMKPLQKKGYVYVFHHSIHICSSAIADYDKGANDIPPTQRAHPHPETRQYPS